MKDDGRKEWQTEDKATYDEKTMDSSIDVLLCSQSSDWLLDK